MVATSNIASVEVLEGCQPEEIPSSVFESEKPLLLKGLVSDWPAVERCSGSLEETYTYINSFWTGEPVTVYASEDDIGGRFFYNDDFTGFNFRSGKAPLNQVFQKLDETEKSGEPQSIYVGSTAVDRWLPGFRATNDIQLPFDDALVNFWLGNRTSVSAHFDFPDNVACVVAGRRRFTLFPPEQVSNLYIGPVDRTPSGQSISLVDFRNPDFDRFPRFREALEHALTYELEPGDAIFIPGMWWHQVESLTSFNLLVNYWWRTTMPEMGSPMNALMLAILSLRDLPTPKRRAWKALFDHYIFDADESVYSHIPEAGRGSLAPLDADSARKLRAELLNRLNQ